MLRFGANLGTLFVEHPFLDRIERAAAAGFEAVEFPFPWPYRDVEAVAVRLALNGLRLVQMNLPWGDAEAGERGTANDPRRRAEFRDGVARGLEAADRLGCPRLLCLCGTSLPDVAPDTQWSTIVENLRHAAEQADAAGARVLVEPINPFDVPGTLLTTMAEAARLLDRVGHPAAGILCDVYHVERSGEGACQALTTYLDRVEHVEIADCPGRREPGTGRIDFGALFDTLDRTGFAGWLCAEYLPSGRTEDSLAWRERWAGEPRWRGVA